jgi:DNA-directed RNA polymerase specialized sigma24 family protein
MAKDIISAYRTVCRELQGLEAYEVIARMRLQNDYNVMYKGKMPSSEMCYVPLTTSIPTFNVAAEEYNETVKTIQQYRGVKMQMENVIARMSEPEQIIIHLHIEQGLNIREIAERSHYEYGYLRKLASNIRNNKTFSTSA